MQPLISCASNHRENRFGSNAFSLCNILQLEQVMFDHEAMQQKFVGMDAELKEYKVSEY